jgi:hypothetical protein
MRRQVAAMRFMEKPGMREELKSIISLSIKDSVDASIDVISGIVDDFLNSDTVGNVGLGINLLGNTWVEVVKNVIFDPASKSYPLETGNNVIELDYESMTYGKLKELAKSATLEDAPFSARLSVYNYYYTMTGVFSMTTDYDKQLKSLVASKSVIRGIQKVTNRPIFWAVDRLGYDKLMSLGVVDTKRVVVNNRTVNNVIITDINKFALNQVGISSVDDYIRLLRKRDSLQIDEWKLMNKDASIWDKKSVQDVVNGNINSHLAWGTGVWNTASLGVQSTGNTEGEFTCDNKRQFYYAITDPRSKNPPNYVNDMEYLAVENDPIRRDVFPVTWSYDSQPEQSRKTKVPMYTGNRGMYPSSIGYINEMEKSLPDINKRMALKDHLEKQRNLEGWKLRVTVRTIQDDVQFFGKGDLKTDEWYKDGQVGTPSQNRVIELLEKVESNIDYDRINEDENLTNMLCTYVPDTRSLTVLGACSCSSAAAALGGAREFWLVDTLRRMVVDGILDKGSLIANNAIWLTETIGGGALQKQLDVLTYKFKQLKITLSKDVILNPLEKLSPLVALNRGKNGTTTVQIPSNDYEGLNSKDSTPLRFVDGGYLDNDGVANGIIIWQKNLLNNKKSGVNQPTEDNRLRVLFLNSAEVSVDPTISEDGSIVFSDDNTSSLFLPESGDDAFSRTKNYKVRRIRKSAAGLVRSKDVSVFNKDDWGKGRCIWRGRCNKFDNKNMRCDSIENDCYAEVAISWWKTTTKINDDYGIEAGTPVDLFIVHTNTNNQGPMIQMGLADLGTDVERYTLTAHTLSTIIKNVPSDIFDVVFKGQNVPNSWGKTLPSDCRVTNCNSELNPVKNTGGEIDPYNVPVYEKGSVIEYFNSDRNVWVPGKIVDREFKKRAVSENFNTTFTWNLPFYLYTVKLDDYKVNKQQMISDQIFTNNNMSCDLGSENLESIKTEVLESRRIIYNVSQPELRGGKDKNEIKMKTRGIFYS